MGRTSKITLAERTASQYFIENGQSVFPESEFNRLVESKRNQWALPATTSPDQIARKWVENGFINAHLFKLTDGREELLYLYGDPTIYEIAVSLRPKSYISHYPAVFLHDLTTQVPKTIYTTQELSAKRNRNYSLTQTAIDKAFSQPQRRSHLSTTYENYTIILLSGMHCNRSGVLLSTRYKNAFSYTGVERTLIDITVRPNYAGGAFAVLEAYRRAIERNIISSNKLATVFESIPFIYPYQQAVGFYLEKAGYDKIPALFRETPKPFQFYLDYEMKEKSYDPVWKIWYPKGM